jgi:hypothetical protein
VTAPLELALDALGVVQLAVDDDVHAAVFARDRLVARSEIDDAQSRVSESGATVRRDSLLLTVGPACSQAFGAALEIRWRYDSARGEHRNDPAHRDSLDPNDSAMWK